MSEFIAYIDKVISGLKEYIIGGIIGAVISVIISAIIELILQPINKIRKHLRVIKPLRDRVLKEMPQDFVDFTCLWKEGYNDKVYRDSSSFYLQFKDFVQSNQNLVVIIGKYGTGKTYLCKYLAGKLVNKFKFALMEIPIYIDSSKFRSENILSEIITQINNKGFTDSPLDLSPLDLGNLIKKKRVVIFLDGLDQLPYLLSSSNILDAILDFVLNNFQMRTDKSKVVMVVREEFYQVSPEFRNFVSQQNISIAYVQGFSEEQQIKNCIQSMDKQYAEERWEKIRKLLATEPNLKEIFSIPVILKRFISIDIAYVKQMVSTGTMLSKIYKLSFEDL